MNPLFLFLSQLSLTTAFTFHVVLPSSCATPSPFVDSCNTFKVSAPQIDVVRVVQGQWKEAGSGSNWEYASSECGFTCSSAASFVACQSVATLAASRNLNYYPATSQCCVSNCTRVFTSSRMTNDGTVRKAFRDPSLIAVNSTVPCSLEVPEYITSLDSENSVFRCVFPDSINDMDIKVLNANRSFSTLVTNVNSDRWFYPNFVSYSEPYTFSFQPQNYSGCNNSDFALKDTLVNQQRVCADNITVKIFRSKPRSLARGVWLGTTANASLASNLRIVLAQYPEDPLAQLSFTSGVQSIPNQQIYIPFHDIENPVGLKLMPPVGVDRFELSEFRLDVSSNCPQRPLSNGSMICSLYPPEAVFSKCNVTCDTGFKTQEASQFESNCLDYSAWSNNPVCEPVQCPASDMNRPKNGNVTCTDEGFGLGKYLSVCKYQCNPGFQLSHARDLLCTSSGAWSDNAPTCDNINDCNNLTACPPGAKCFDGIQRVYCGLTIKSLTINATSGGNLVSNVVQLSSQSGGAAITFDVDLNNAVSVEGVQYGNVHFPTIYTCSSFTLLASTVTCYTPAGVGRKLFFHVVYKIAVDTGEDGIANTESSFSDENYTISISYPAPFFLNRTLRLDDEFSLYEGNPFIGKTTLGEVIQLNGNFGPPNIPKVLYYGTLPASNNFTCRSDSNCVPSNTKLCCKTEPEKQGRDLVFKLVILNDLEVYSIDRYSYPVPPRITRVSGCSDVGVTTQNCSTAGAVITVEGVGFSSGATVTVFPPAVVPYIENSSTTLLTFNLAPGAGTDLPVVIRAADLDSDGSIGWLSYAPPVVTGVTGIGCTNTSAGVKDCPKNGTKLTFVGSNFGRTELPVEVLIGTKACGNVTYKIEHSEFTCDLGPGYQADLIITLVQKRGRIGQSSNFFVSYYQCPAGQFINYADRGECYTCPINTYTPVAGLTVCTECAAGKFSDPKLDECSLCLPGTASIGGQNCTLCQPGFHAPNPGQKLECIACPAGRFSNHTGGSECIPCSVGRYQKNTNSSACDSCEMGKYQLATAEASCILCEAGFFANATGLSECFQCEPGTSNGFSNQSACEPCEKGRASSIWGARVCDRCGPGQMASSDIGAVQCVDCPAGSFQPDANQTGCELCTAGSFSIGKQATCTPCPAGRAASSGNMSACDICTSGKFALGPGNFSCAECPRGTFSTSPSDVASCTPCQVGKFAATTNSSMCVPCVRGRAQSRTRQSSCDICERGRFSDTMEATECLQCSAGQFASSTNSTVCSVCSNGRFSQMGQSSCTSCPVGKASTDPSSCVECRPGKYAPTLALATCMDCESGYVQELAGQSVCQACESGKHSNGSLNCLPCLPGEYENSQASSKCKLCSPGSFTEVEGRSACELCVPGTFLNRLGATACEQCEPDKYSRASAATACFSCDPPQIRSGRDCVCPAGTYLSEYDKCPPCPKGAWCSTGGLTYQNLKAAPGYWRSKLYITPTFYKCLTLSHCPDQPMLFDPNIKDDLNYSAVVCGAFRRGPICALCLDGYKSATVVSTCVDCENNTKGTVLSILIILGMIIALGITYWFLLRADTQLLLSQQAVVKAHGDIKLSRATSSPVDTVRRAHQQQQPGPSLDVDSSKNSPKVTHKDSKAQFDFDDDDYVIPALHTARRGGGKETGQIKIMIGFFQIIYNLTAIRNLSWPVGFKMVVSAFSFINLDFIPWNTVGCAVPFNFYVRITSVALSPFVVMALVFFAYFLPSFWKDTRDFSDHDLARVIRSQKRNQLKKMFLFALFLMYPFISREVLSFFLCDTVDGVSYLVPDFNLRCYDELWRQWLAPVIVMIIVYPIGCPLTVLFLLYRHAKRDLLDTDFVRIGYGFLFEPYQNARWWFEFLDMVHKILLTSVLNFFPDGTQLPAALVIVGVYTIAILLCTPYIEDGDDNFHLLAQAEIFNIVMCAMVLQTYTLDPGSAAEVLLSILLCALFFMLIGEVLRRFIIKIRPQIHRARRAIRESRGSSTPGKNLTSNLASIESKIEQNAYKLSVDDES